MKITAKSFKTVTGHKLVNDDLERYNCNARCPIYNEKTEPYDHAEIDQTAEYKAITDALVNGIGTVLTTIDPHSMLHHEYLPPFIILIKKDSIRETD